MKKKMVVSEQVGWLEGFQYMPEDDDLGLQLGVPNGINMTYFSVPFNVNRPKKFDLDDFRNKKVKITVEIVEDE